MIRHIVMWKFKEGTQEEVKKFREGLLALKAVIPEIKSIDLGINCYKKGDNYDAVLVAEFETIQELEIYTAHPQHLEVSEICKAIRVSRVAVDYEI